MGDWTRHAVVDFVKLLRKPERSIWMRRCANLPSHLLSGRKESRVATYWERRRGQLLPAAISYRAGRGRVSVQGKCAGNRDRSAGAGANIGGDDTGRTGRGKACCERRYSLVSLFPWPTSTLISAHGCLLADYRQWVIWPARPVAAMPAQKRHGRNQYQPWSNLPRIMATLDDASQAQGLCGGMRVECGMTLETPTTATGFADPR